MRYKEHLKRQEEKRAMKKERINSNQIMQKTLNVLKTLKKVGLKVLKITINLVKHSVNIAFWVGTEAVKWVVYSLELVFHKLPKNLKRAFVFGLLGITIASASINYFSVKSLVEKNNQLKSFASINETSVNAKTASDKPNQSDKKIEVEVIEEKDIALTKTVPEVNKSSHVEEKDVTLTKTVSKVNKPSFIGEMSIISEIGKVDVGYLGTTEVRYTDSTENLVIEKVDEYGIGQFTSSPKKRYVGNFMKYLSENEVDFFKKYFDGVGQPGTTTFNTGWYNASKYEAEKFKELQYDYIFDKYVEPTVIAVMDKYGIDLMSTKAYQEFAYSTANQYDKKGTLTLFEKAKITSDMSEKEVITAVQNEKISSLGNYTYTEKWGYNDAWRHGIKVRAEKELATLLEMIEE